MSDARNEVTPYERARRRVEELRRFYTGLVVFFVVNLVLFLIDMSIPGGTWFYWPLGIWGAFVLIEGITLFLRRERGPLGPRWEERKLRQLLSRESSRQGPRPPQPLAP